MIEASLVNRNGNGVFHAGVTVTEQANGLVKIEVAAATKHKPNRVGEVPCRSLVFYLPKADVRQLAAILSAAGLETED